MQETFVWKTRACAENENTCGAGLFVDSEEEAREVRARRDYQHGHHGEDDPLCVQSSLLRVKMRAPKVKKKIKAKATGDGSRHKFMSYAQQVAALPAPKFGVGLLRGAAGELSADADAGLLRAALAHWREHNLSEGFQDLMRKCQPLTLNVGLVLHHRQTLADHLYAAGEQELAEGATGLGMEPVLDMWAALAGDLQGELFKPFFGQFLSQALRGTRLQNTSVLAQAHASLASVLKVMRRYQNYKEEEAVSEFASAVTEAWPHLERVQEGVLTRLANALAQFKRKGKDDQFIKALFNMASAPGANAWPLIAHAVLYACLLPSPNFKAWEVALTITFTDLNAEDRFAFYAACFEAAASVHPQHYDNLAKPAIERVRLSWTDDPVSHLSVLDALLSTEGDIRGPLDLLKWVADGCLVAAEDVPKDLVSSIVAKLLNRSSVHLQGSDAKDKTLAVVRQFLDSANEDGFDLADVCAFFTSAKDIWREALKVTSRFHHSGSY